MKGPVRVQNTCIIPCANNSEEKWKKLDRKEASILLIVIKSWIGDSASEDAAFPHYIK